MALSKQSIETLLDLVENRIDALHIHDIDDALELDFLEATRVELRAMLSARKDRRCEAQVIPLFPETMPSY